MVEVVEAPAFTDRRSFVEGLNRTREVSEYIGWQYDNAGSYSRGTVDIRLNGHPRDVGFTQEVRRAFFRQPSLRPALLDSAINQSSPDQAERQLSVIAALSEEDFSVDVKYRGIWTPLVAQEFQVALLSVVGLLPDTANH